MKFLICPEIQVKVNKSGRLARLTIQQEIGDLETSGNQEPVSCHCLDAASHL